MHEGGKLMRHVFLIDELLVGELSYVLCSTERGLQKMRGCWCNSQ